MGRRRQARNKIGFLGVNKIENIDPLNAQFTSTSKINTNRRNTRNHPTLTSKSTKCLICSREVNPGTKRDFTGDELSAVKVLCELLKILKISPTVCRYLLGNSLPTVVYCESCQQTVSTCLKISQEIDHLRNVLEELVGKIKHGFIEGYSCRPDDSQKGNANANIRKILAQCWTTCRVQLKKLPQTLGSQKSTVQRSQNSPSEEISPVLTTSKVSGDWREEQKNSVNAIKSEDFLIESLEGKDVLLKNPVLSRGPYAIECGTNVAPTLFTESLECQFQQNNTSQFIRDSDQLIQEMDYLANNNNVVHLCSSKMKNDTVDDPNNGKVELRNSKFVDTILTPQILLRPLLPIPEYCYEIEIENDEFENEIDNDEFENAIDNDEFESAIDNDEFENEIKSDTFENAIENDEFENAIKNDEFEHEIKNDDFKNETDEKVIGDIIADLVPKLEPDSSPLQMDDTDDNDIEIPSFSAQQQQNVTRSPNRITRLSSEISKSRKRGRAKFSQRDSFDSHEDSTNYNFSCSKCETSYDVKYELTNTGKKVLPCVMEYCQVVSRSTKCHRRHHGTHHSTDITGPTVTKAPLKCKVCDKQFGPDHDVFLNELQEQRFRCDFNEGKCGKVFDRYRALSTHHRHHHYYIPGQPPLEKFDPERHVCKYCQRVFNKAWSCRTHVITAHTKEFKYYCEICGLGRPSLPKLKQHYASHTDEKPYKCQLCPKEFKKISEFKYHMNKHNNFRQYMCEICGKGYCNRNSLVMHTKIHERKKFKENARNQSIQISYLGSEYQT